MAKNPSKARSALASGKRGILALLGRASQSAPLHPPRSGASEPLGGSLAPVSSAPVLDSQRALDQVSAALLEADRLQHRIDDQKARLARAAPSAKAGRSAAPKRQGP